MQKGENMSGEPINITKLNTGKEKTNYSHKGVTATGAENSHTPTLSLGETQTSNQAENKTPAPQSGDSQNVKKETTINPKNTAESDAYKADPVNMATGAFIYEDNDYILPESSHDFKLIRSYNSQENPKNRKSIGRKWTLSVDTAITRVGELTVVTLPDTKAVEYRYINGYYINKRGNTKQYTLIKPENNFIFTDNENNNTYIYDNEGKIQTIIDKHGNKTKYSYSENGIKSVELSTGLSLTFTWKDMKISEVTDNGGRSVKYHYDRGILTKVTRCDGTEISYTYDENENLKTVTDGNGCTYITNQYDEKSRVTIQHLSDGGLIKFSYNEKEKTNTCIDEINNITTKYTYDEKLDITKITYEDGTTETTDLDENGLIIKKTDREGAATYYTRDIYGHIITKEEPSGLITSYTYDKNNIIKITDNEGRKETYTYDSRNNITHETKLLEKQENGKEKILEKHYTYDKKGRLIKIEKNGITETEYKYTDNHNRPSEERKSTGETIKRKYDKYLRTTEKETADGTEKYSYTPYNKIKTQETPKKGKTSYYYDKAWRQIKKVTIKL